MVDFKIIYDLSPAVAWKSFIKTFAVNLQIQVGHLYYIHWHHQASCTSHSGTQKLIVGVSPTPTSARLILSTSPNVCCKVRQLSR